jgi:hypothetical protein
VPGYATGYPAGIDASLFPLTVSRFSLEFGRSLTSAVAARRQRGPRALLSGAALGRGQLRS